MPSRSATRLTAATTFLFARRSSSQHPSSASSTAAVKRVAERLGNTPTVCRSCYIHPAVLEAYERGRSIEEFRPRRTRRLIRGRQPEYTVEESALLKLLRAGKNGGG